jgi:trans-2,3-dihydro-3-hydroxyanthranilate isomerase
MRRIRYKHLDVFSSEPFGGNQLAVFFDADSLDASEMQAIAREMNFSESTFILPPTDPAQTLTRVRIFTPATELPLAGHPTIGTTIALAQAGRITSERPTAKLELGVGPITVEAVYTDGEPRAAWMTQPPPGFTPWSGDRATLLAALGLDADALATNLPIERGSAGVPFIYLPLRDLEALGKARHGANLQAALADADPRTGLYLFTIQPLESSAVNASVRSRMFAPGMGIIEDSATGAAAGPMGCYLARNRLLAALSSERASVAIMQGVEMGRPSQIEVELTLRGEEVTTIRVGGAAITLAEGEFTLPDKESL